MEVEKMSFPKDWKIVRLGDVARYINGRAFKPAEWEKAGLPIIRIQNLNKDAAPYNYSSQPFEEKYKVRNGDLLFAWSASLGAYIWNGGEAWLNQHIFRVEPIENCDKKYLFYALERIVAELYSKAHGSGMVHVTKGKFEATEIPLPPLAEQQRIVATIEELFSELDAGKGELEKATQQLKVYRQAVLKWAFEGRLTNDVVVNGELPSKWQEVELGTLMESVRNGYSKKPDETGSYKILRISSVRPNSLDIEDTRWLKERLPEENEIQENDLLFTRYNGSHEFVGVSAIVPKLNEPIFYPDKLIRCRPKLKDKMHSLFLQYATNYGKARSFVLSRIKTTAGQTGIAGAEIKQMPVLLPPLEEQRRIVQEIEARLSVCDKMEETIAGSMQQAEALRQSILKKAFEGKLL